LYFGRCKSSSQKFSVIGFAVRELQVLKVKEVEMFVLFSSIKANGFSFGAQLW
jgi:hypothetical protein